MIWQILGALYLALGLLFGLSTYRVLGTSSEVDLASFAGLEENMEEVHILKKYKLTFSIIMCIFWGVFAIISLLGGKSDK